MNARAYTLLGSILASAILAPLIPAQAADPVSIFGFALGQPVQLPECPHHTFSGTKMYSPIVLQTCIEDAANLPGYSQPLRTVMFSRDEAPAIVKQARIYLLEDGKVLTGAHFYTSGVSDQDAVLAALKQKFGAPASQSKAHVTIGDGSSVSATVADWANDQVVVHLQGQVDGGDTGGEVDIDTPKAAQQRKAVRMNVPGARRQL